MRFGAKEKRMSVKNRIKKLENFNGYVLGDFVTVYKKGNLYEFDGVEMDKSEYEKWCDELEKNLAIFLVSFKPYDAKRRDYVKD